MILHTKGIFTKGYPPKNKRYDDIWWYEDMSFKITIWGIETKEKKNNPEHNFIVIIQYATWNILKPLETSLIH